MEAGAHLPNVSNGGLIELGRSVRFAGLRVPVRLAVGEGGVLRVGGDTFFNDGAKVVARERVEIGSHVLIGDFTMIMDTNFHEVEAGAGVVTTPVTIEDNVWIGLGAIVLPGVTVGTGTVVAAGSVVIESLPPGVLAAGNPAAVKRRLDIPDGWIRR